MKKVEQVTIDGDVVVDYDQPLKGSEIYKFLSNKFKMVSNKKSSPFIIEYKDKIVALYIKNITYLGHPHPIFKKRIQIPHKFIETLNEYENVILLGIYRYNNHYILSNFDYEKYKNNQANNSSAHVNTIDILKAVENEIFEKIDKNENKITCFTENKIIEVFDSVLKLNNLFYENELTVFKKFNEYISKRWYGKYVYEEMIREGYNNAYQAEWVGFFLEYKFEKFLENNPLFMKYCKFISNKKTYDIDLDLYFPRKNYYGDLKTHTRFTNIQGNDKETIDKVISNYKKFWYIVYSHTTILDKNRDHIVTKYWNKKINENYKKNKSEYSYGSRMKNNIVFKDMNVLEVNNFNLKYLKIYNQGKNSNGKPRKPKIMIPSKDIDNFAIYRHKFK